MGRWQADAKAFKLIHKCDSQTWLFVLQAELTFLGTLRVGWSPEKETLDESASGLSSSFHKHG